MSTETTINASPYEASILMLWGFRYALGRSTSAVTDCIKLLTRNIRLFTNWELCQMIAEITDAESRGALGHKIDVEEWTQFRAFLYEVIKDAD